MDYLLLDSLGQGIDAITAQDIEREPLAVLDACLDSLRLNDVPDDTEPLVGERYRLTEKVTPTSRQRANNDAIALLRGIQAGDHDVVTEQQKAVLSRYTGTGGNLTGEDGLKGSAYEYYTPIEVAETMWDLLKDQGFSGGIVLDPCSGTGIFGASAPGNILMHSIELSEVSGSINKLVNEGRGHAVTVSPFEKVAASTQDESFDAIISNVPFGSNADRGANKTLDPKYQRDSLEEYFIKRSLDKLRPGGLAMFIVPTKVLDNTNFKKFRQTVLLKADLIGAYRLPNKVFEQTGADVTTDIIVLKKFSADVADKITGLYEGGGVETLRTAKVLDADIVSGRYFKTYGKHYVLGETVTSKGQFGDVEKVVNNDSMVNILKLVKRFPASRINYELLDVTDAQDPIDFMDGDVRLLNGATFEMRNNAWVQVVTDYTDIDEDVFKQPYTMLSGGTKANDLIRYFAMLQSQGKRPPPWLVELKAEANTNPQAFEFWLCVYCVAEALKQPCDDYSLFYSDLTKQMIGYADQFASGKVKTSNGSHKRLLAVVGIAFDSSMPDGISRFWRGQEQDLVVSEASGRHAAYERAVYTGIAQDWQVDVSVIQQSRPDFNPMNDPDYCINEDGTKVTLSRDYYVGNYGQFLQTIEQQIESATDPRIKEKLLQQKQNAEKMIVSVDVKKLRYNLMSTVIPRDMKYRYFSEFVDSGVTLDGDDRLVMDGKVEDAAYLLRRINEHTLNSGKMDDKDSTLRRFMLNRIFDSLNNNERLSVKLGANDSIKSDQKTQLLNLLVNYYNQLNTSFDAWLKSNDLFMIQLDEQFNAPDNKSFPAQLDESPVTVEGFAPKKEGFVSLNGYQNAEIRRLSRRFSGICGFDVGLGKTLTALASVQNMHNIGVKSRTFFVVPGHTISKWFNDMKMAYASTDDVLVIGTNRGQQSAVNSKHNTSDFALLTKPEGKQYRKILMTVDAFNMIPLRELTVENHFDATERGSVQSNKQRDREKRKGEMAERLKKINKYESKLPYFEDMSVDSLVFDEAQMFKNGKAGGGQFNRIKGLSLLSENSLSARAISAAIKSWYVRGKSAANDGVVLLTATPFTNSPVEILTMLSLAVGDNEAMAQLGGRSIRSVEDFLSTFANIDPIEQTNIVGDLVSVDTFTGFSNAQLLKNAIHSVSNIKTAKDGGLKIPDEDENQVCIDLTSADKAMLQNMKAAYSMAKQMVKDNSVMADEESMKQYRAYQNLTGEADETIAHPFNLIAKMSDVILTGAEMGLMRIVPVNFDPSQLAEATKVEKMFNDKQIVIKTERRYPSVDPDLISSKMVANKNGELSEQFTVQCRVNLDSTLSRLVLNVDDAGVVAQLMTMIDKAGLTVKPKLSTKVQAMIENFNAEQSAPKHEGHAKQLIFCDNLAMQHLIKRGLIAFSGISASKIAIINAQTLPDGSKGSPDTEHMQEVQDKFADNEFTVVIANKKAETGIDLQRGTQAIHHLTTGWTPDSIQQRNGRGIRQGNKQASVTVYHYNANGTFDEYKQRLISGKSDWIDQLMQNGGEIKGTLTVATELTDQDYEDMIEADNPEKIAALLQAKADRDALQRSGVIAAKTDLLYNNMIKANTRPIPTVAGRVRAIMDTDAKRIFDLLKKANNAKSDDKVEGYRRQAESIALRYDQMFDGRLTMQLVLEGISNLLDRRGARPSSYDLYSKMPRYSESSKTRFDPEQWIEDNADTQISDVFNRARNIVSTAKNMIQATKESFLNYQDNGYSNEEKQALIDGSAAFWKEQLWMSGEYVKGVATPGPVSYGYTLVVAKSNGTYGVEHHIDGTATSNREKVPASERSDAIEYMVKRDVDKCIQRGIFDLQMIDLFYSKALPEIRTIVADRVLKDAKEWQEKTTMFDLRALYHKPTRRDYWHSKLLPDLATANPTVVTNYNKVFVFDAPIDESRQQGLIKNKELNQYGRQRHPMLDGKEFFDDDLSIYLKAESEQVVIPKIVADALFAATDYQRGILAILNSLNPDAITGKQAITQEQMDLLLRSAFDQKNDGVIANADELFAWWMQFTPTLSLKSRFRIQGEDGAVSGGPVDIAHRVATLNKKGQNVVGLKSKSSGRDDNVLYLNKESLKAMAKYAYWSGRHTMWIVDLDSMQKIIDSHWYDIDKVEIVEAKY